MSNRNQCYNFNPFTCLSKLLALIYGLDMKYILKRRAALYNFCNPAFVLSTLTKIVHETEQAWNGR